MLDLSIWNEEYSAGIARTGGGVPMEGGNAKSANCVNPPMGRFVRIYIGRRNGGSLSLSLSVRVTNSNTYNSPHHLII